MKPGHVVSAAEPRRWVAHAMIAFLLAAACVAQPVFAAAGGEQNPAEAPIGTLFRWLNFLLVFGGAAYLIAKKAPAFFGSHARAIAAAITEAAATQAEAERQLREAEAKLARLDHEAVELRAAGQRESAAEAERIRAVARDEAEKISRAARAEIEAAERAARMELKALAARLAVERAEAMLRKQITAETQSWLFRSFLDNLARSAN